MSTITLSTYEDYRCVFEDFIENEEVIAQLVRCIKDEAFDLADIAENDLFVLDYLVESYEQGYCNYEIDYDATTIDEFSIYLTLNLDDFYLIEVDFNAITEVFSNLCIDKR